MRDKSVEVVSNQRGRSRPGHDPIPNKPDEPAATETNQRDTITKQVQELRFKVGDSSLTKSQRQEIHDRISLLQVKLLRLAAEKNISLVELHQPSPKAPVTAERRTDAHAAPSPAPNSDEAKLCQDNVAILSKKRTADLSQETMVLVRTLLEAQIQQSKEALQYVHSRIDELLRTSIKRRTFLQNRGSFHLLNKRISLLKKVGLPQYAQVLERYATIGNTSFISTTLVSPKQLKSGSIKPHRQPKKKLNPNRDSARLKTWKLRRSFTTA